MEESETPRPAHAGVHIPPPFVFVAGFALGLFLEDLLPLSLLPGILRPLAVVVGWALVTAGTFLSGWGLATFFRSRTAIMPNRPARRLVTGGPYRFSRNPMYVAVSGIYLGVALLVGSPWPLLFLPLVLWILYSWIVKSEERYLTAEFGDEYRAYCARVRRWL